MQSMLSSLGIAASSLAASASFPYVATAAGAVLLSVGAMKYLNKGKKKYFKYTEVPYSSFVPSLSAEEVRKQLDWNNMRHYWYPVALSRDITDDKPHGIKLFDEPLCLYRDKQGRITCIVDRCPHRSAPLSIGQMVNGNVECVYHGWQFGTGGQCTKIPSVSVKSNMPEMIQAVPRAVHEELGYIWVWAGPQELAHPELIQRFVIKESYLKKRQSEWDYTKDIGVESGLLMDNLLDFAHIDFTHDGKIGKRSVATAVRMTEIKDHPYLKENPMTKSYMVTCPEAEDMSRKNVQLAFHFIPPCFIRAEHFNNREEPKLVQVFMNVPFAKNNCRHFSRFYFSFMPTWVPHLPFAQTWFNKASTEILMQDVELLVGITENEKIGAPLVGNVVGADILIKLYREWREKSEKLADPWFKCWTGNQCRKEHIVSKKKNQSSSSSAASTTTDIEDLLS